MSSLFSKPDIPQEDPSITRQREIEQQRAEDAKTKATQDQLRQQTQLNTQKYGTRSLFDVFNSPKSSLLGSG